MADENNKTEEAGEKKTHFNGAYVAIGVGVGAAIGAATGQLAIWLPVGVAIGVALALNIGKKDSSED